MSKFTTILATVLAISFIGSSLAACVAGNSVRAKFTSKGSFATAYPSSLQPNYGLTVEAYAYKNTYEIEEYIFSIGGYHLANDAVGQYRVYECAANGCVNLVDTSNSYNDAQWHHVAFTVNTTTVALYIDGVATLTLPSKTPIVYANAANARAFVASSSNVNFWWGGYLAQVRVWDYARTAQQIRANKDVTITSTPCGLRLNLPLNGQTVNVNGATLHKDFSSFANHVNATITYESC